MTPENLLAELVRCNVEVSLAGDKLRFEAPAGVLTPEFKETLAKHKPELLAYLRGYIEELGGNRYRTHQTRPRCMEAGHCCWVSEADCELYPLVRDGRLSGLCRERVPKGGGGQCPG